MTLHQHPSRSGVTVPSYFPWLFSWVLGLWTQVLRLVQQTLCPLSYLLSIGPFFKTFYWFLCEFHIIYPHPSISPSALATFPQKRMKVFFCFGFFLNLTVETVTAVCHIACSLSTHLYLEIFIAVSHWSGSRALASTTLSIPDPHRDSSWIRGSWQVSECPRHPALLLNVIFLGSWLRVTCSAYPLSGCGCWFLVF